MLERGAPRVVRRQRRRLRQHDDFDHRTRPLPQRVLDHVRNRRGRPRVRRRDRSERHRAVGLDGIGPRRIGHGRRVAGIRRLGRSAEPDRGRNERSGRVAGCIVARGRDVLGGTLLPDRDVLNRGRLEGDTHRKDRRGRRPERVRHLIGDPRLRAGGAVGVRVRDDTGRSVDRVHPVGGRDRRGSTVRRNLGLVDAHRGGIIDRAQCDRDDRARTGRGETTGGVDGSEGPGAVRRDDDRLSSGDRRRWRRHRRRDGRSHDLPDRIGDLVAHRGRRAPVRG